MFKTLMHIRRPQTFRCIKQSHIVNNSVRAFSTEAERESMDYDVLIVGGGPAGLSAAIRMRQLAEEKNVDLSVCLIEKGAQIGAHILSGNCFQPRGLDELIPDWKEQGAPIHTPVTEDQFSILFEKNHIDIPTILLPKAVHNHGNYVISLGNLCEWLGEKAESMGVDILPGIAGDKIIYNKDGSVGGIVTGDFGIAKDGTQKPTYSPGIEIKAKQTILTEGCRGSLTQRIKQNFNLDKDCISSQHYGLGLKEVWRVAEGNPHFKPGRVHHTVHWPLPSNVYGGSFLYHMNPDLIHVGLVVGLDYKNPYLNPYELFQMYKTHPQIKKVLEGGECLSYGARSLNEGGYHAIPKLSFPGGMLAGDSAGFLNVAKIKGAHNAIKSGMIAAESIYQQVTEGKPLEQQDLTNYEKNVRDSWVVKELKESRNFKGGFDKGLWFGLLHGRIITTTKGKEPWTLSHKVKDSDATAPKEQFKPIEYPKKDGKLTFDLLTNLMRSGTNHEHDQPSHLKIKPGMEKVPVETSLEVFAGPEQRFCPAKVYEFITDEKTNEAKLQINAQNCIHCKCCSIKTPKEYIDWNVPEGGGGPNYSGM